MKIKTLKAIILGGNIIQPGVVLTVEIDVDKATAERLLRFGDMVDLVEEVKVATLQFDGLIMPNDEPCMGPEVEFVPQPEVNLAPTLNVNPAPPHEPLSPEDFGIEVNKVTVSGKTKTTRSKK